MKLVFIHGWGLDAHLWDGVLALLPNVKTEIIERGFFGAARHTINSEEPAVLIGHSLGLIHGFNLRQNWISWVAVNSFPRFITTDHLPGCVAAGVVRDMRQRLSRDPHKTLTDFHQRIGATPPSGIPDIDELRSGLDELQSGDIADISAPKPGLILASCYDPLVPAVASAALAQNHQQKIVWHESDSHVLPQSKADWCAHHIATFVQHHAE